MITADYQNSVGCTCGKPATQLEVSVHTEHNVRRVAYRCHAECLSDPVHGARLKEVDTFIAAMDKLAFEAGRNLPELPKGLIKEIDLGYVQPSACEAYEKATPLVIIQGFGQTDEMVLDPIVVASTSAADLQKLAVEVANKGMESLRLKFEAGKF